MNPKFSSSLTSFESENISADLQGDSHVATSKMIVSIVIAVTITSSTLVSPVMTPVPAIKVIHEAKDQNINNHSQANPNNMYFSNNENKDDIIEMNNDHLEVEDLADRVTQSQIDEIKDHFDTKINSLETNLTLKYEAYADKKIDELKSFISTENKEIKTSRKESRRFWLSSIIVPFAVVVATLIGTKLLGIY